MVIASDTYWLQYKLLYTHYNTKTTDKPDSNIHRHVKNTGNTLSIKLYKSFIVTFVCHNLYRTGFVKGDRRPWKRHQEAEQTHCNEMHCATIFFLSHSITTIAYNGGLPKQTTFMRLYSPTVQKSIRSVLIKYWPYKT